MADDFDALRTIRAPHAELDADRAARMRTRALATVPGYGAPTGTTLVDDPVRPDPNRPEAVRPGPDRDGRDRPLELLPPVATDTRILSRTELGSRRPFLVVIAAAAAVLAAVVGLGIARSGNQTAVVADQPRPTSVTDLATNASTLVDRPLAAGEYAHILVERADPAGDGTARNQVLTRETWSTSDGAGRERYSDVEVVGEDGRTITTLEPARVDEYATGAPAFGSFGYATLRGLPTDPDALRAVLAAGTFGRADDDATIARLVSEILMLDATPPAVRAAALTLLADEGATLLDEVRDPAGNSGIGIVLPLDDGSTSVYVVTRDGQLLGTYDLPAGAPVDPADAVGWTAVVAQDRVTALD